MTSLDIITAPTFDAYLELRSRFAVSRAMAVEALEQTEPLARRALGVHARREQSALGETLPFIPVVTPAEQNGGWGELMPVWFKPSERPIPLYILDNWALPALALQTWLGDIGPAFNVDNLLRVFVGGDLLLPFLPAAQRGAQFLRHGALTVLLGLSWLPAQARDAFLQGAARGGRRFADACGLRGHPDPAGLAARLEAEAFLMAEGRGIAGPRRAREFITHPEQFAAYSALYGGLCLSLAALHAWYGPDWEGWIFQAVNVHYRYAAFGLEAWARWLDTK